MQGNTQTSAADTDDEFLNDVVVRAAANRVRREIGDEAEVVDVMAERFDDVAPHKSDYIMVNLKSHTSGNSHTLGYLVQKIVDTGAARIAAIDTDNELIRIAPTED
jgi:hypothetical protein